MKRPYLSPAIFWVSYQFNTARPTGHELQPQTFSVHSFTDKNNPRGTLGHYSSYFQSYKEMQLIKLEKRPHGPTKTVSHVPRYAIQRTPLCKVIQRSTRFTQMERVREVVWNSVRAQEHLFPSEKLRQEEGSIWLVDCDRRGRDSEVWTQEMGR